MGAMFQVRQSNWLGHFQAWNVLYCILNIVLSIIFFVLQFVSLALDAALKAIVHLIIDSVVGLVVGFLLCHVGWFCVVKNRGCCGKIGYLAWGIIYFLFVFWPVLVGTLSSSLRRPCSSTLRTGGRGSAFAQRSLGIGVASRVLDQPWCTSLCGMDLGPGSGHGSAWLADCF
ncbi:unnamed protein product [Prorocentrum cordatum]|uniref:Transmembrane protein 107 n=1 Tax=Prorocentrum cordatum TaxID=2364126 RepID=A0ABN9U8K6_9DINO|nr:unnamed protein product [Polarella glacialis]